MHELIKIEDKNGKKTINARDLHKFLESKQEFANWIKNRIKDFGFIENQDFLIILSKTNGRPFKEYFVSLDMAKELSMLERNEKGKQARIYFIEMEKKAKEIQTKQLPTNYIEALKALVKSEEKKELLLIENRENKHKVEFYNDVTDSKTAITMSQVAKTLDKKIGRNKLFEFLREKKILMSNNEPFQTYIDRQWFRVVEQKYSDSEGNIKISIKTLVFQKGVVCINKLLRGK